MTTGRGGASRDSNVDEGRRRHPLGVALLAATSFFYGLGARIHRAFARWTRASRGQPSCAVLSVGGLTVGGAGKTPVAAALALAMRRRGRRVVLASRGYGGHGRNRVTVVSDGSHVYSDVATSGDESLVLAAHAPGVPVLVGRDRRVVAHHAVACFDAELVVLDDGFQHHRLARDLDVVCVDGLSGLGNLHLLPWGPLREPLSALKFADWLCIVDGVDEDERDTKRSDPLKRVAQFFSDDGHVLEAHRRPRGLVSLDRATRRHCTWLAGRRVGLIAGIARPGSVRRTLEALGAEVAAERLFPDHHVYRERDFVGLDPSISEWITTEKDALKILPNWLGATSLFVLEIEIDFDDAEASLDAIESALFSKRGR